ncbi:peptidylprolyl isomerase [Echinicola marina]|uniref:peptidylprolyl isomerase n=1 Tax=Echinicola marina TaxID=2859768 RepID=UPI001CF676ED|nr:peptidylprolyl isomerase [Echinicola marina]UCS95407.1 peptidylprolyl isomerase [Echinicola marina]
MIKASYILSILFCVLRFPLAFAQTPIVELKTTKGNITFELYPEKAPISCANFLKYIKNDKFEGASFYRTVRMDNQANSKVKIEVIQGGLGLEADQSPYKPIAHETTKETGLLHKNGTLSMARAEPGTASSEFFICIGSQPALDFGGKRNPDGQGFAAFGKVINGMKVVRKIQQLADNDQMLVEKVEILSFKIIEE